ncbi:metastasis-associated protein MTA3 isoform X4 [Octopus bimaculoides]|nr:metastasis-associated protein MTA3 isoform X4 [Octopus bimaculoides]
MAANMYRVGDYVYFETSSTTPYQIRRIEELNKTPNGNVEAKVMCFYRRRDISSSLILLADKHQKFPFSETSEDSGHEPLAVPPLTAAAAAGPFPSMEEDSEEINDDITEKQRHQLKHRELFLSRQVETLPATHIRGKCVVTLLNETESLLSYLNKEDTFFYSLVYDPQQKTLLADKGEIRVGSKYQAEITPLLKEGEKDGRSLDELEQLIWLPGPDNTLTPKEIDQFLILARSVGTFARALDCTSTVRQPSLHMSAAAASRDVTLFHAMDTLHRSGYDIAKAVTSLVPQGGPVLCRDEMEEWSASEANLFEEALDKYGKDFNDIRQDFLPWKSLKSIIEYYYMWKTTDRYVQQKRIKAAEAESKLKQVYIPNYNKPNPAAISGKVNGVDGQVSGRACESCYAANSSQWYSWGPAHMQCRLCSSCWIYWKKYGGLKMPTRLDHRIEKSEADRIDPMRERLAHLNAMRMHRCTIAGCGKEFKLKPHLARHLATAHGLAIRAGSPRPMMKTRAAFCLITTPLTRISRRLCKDILRPRHAARCPFVPINIAAIKQESAGLPIFQDGSQGHLIDALTASTEKRTDNNEPKMEPIVPRVSTSQPSIMKKRGYEQSNGLDARISHKPQQYERPKQNLWNKAYENAHDQLD